MFGFLLKIVVMIAIVGGLVGYVSTKSGQSPAQLVTTTKAQIETLMKPGGYNEIIKNVNTGDAVSKASAALDSLVTHSTKDSPVVLGVKVTNESLGAIADILQSLPKDQLQQIKNLMCASPSAN